MVWLSSVSSRPLAHPVPYLLKSPPRLHLNAFRGEPAISGFVWHITSTHSSSHAFVPATGSSLHPDVIGASLWPWVAHPVSGLLDATTPSSRRIGMRGPEGIALLGLAFATAPLQSRLTLLRLSNSPAHSSIGKPSSFQGRTPTVCRPTVSGLFHSPSGVLFTFPSRYWFAIGRQGYLALEGGPPSFPQDFTCPAVLKDTSGAYSLSPTGLSPSTTASSRDLRLENRFLTPCPDWGRDRRTLQPLRDMGPQAVKPPRFGLFPVRSPLLGESRLISFPRGT